MLLKNLRPVTLKHKLQQCSIRASLLY